MTAARPNHSATVRGTLAEQFAPILRLHADLFSGCVPAVDAEVARARIVAGQVAYDAPRVLRSCGELLPCFVRALDAFEVAGLLSNDDRRAILDDDLNVDDLISGWCTGDRTPLDARRRVARQMAIVVGSALLRAASARVGAPSVWKGWTRVACPCCGGSPDIALVEGTTQRTLICARCDAPWRTERVGCLGCNTDREPGIARISNPAIGYNLMICNACGRYLKERPRRGIDSLIVERALTAELDVAAEQRGLRF